jgi:pimeloyl-ACP methyl ester carboxylesterase
MISCSGGPVKLEFAVIDSVYNVNGVKYNADYCKMQILENPQDKGSKVIDIPVIRIRTNSKNAGAPVFILNDGPGLSNFNQVMPTWLVSNHDVVIIGYRGVDGSVNLDIPELNQIALNSNFLSEPNLTLAGKALAKNFKKLEDSLEIDLNQYNLLNMAYDVESARQAFQYEKISIYSVGFGARIAQIFSDISPDAIFRVMMERPKGYGSLSLKPEDIESILDFYEPLAKPINGGKTYGKNIVDGLAALPADYNGHIFDKDKILFTAYTYMNSVLGPAAVHEAFLSAQRGDYDGLKFLDDNYSVMYPQFNLGDYIIKCATSEYDSKKNYINDYSNNSQFAFGSPLGKFIYGTLQKSGFQPVVLGSNIINPDSLNGECLIVTVNLDITNPFEYGEFVVRESYRSAVSFVLSDYNLKILHTYKIEEYTKLIGNFLYVGNYKVFNPASYTVNLVPEKTFKQLALERIQ